MPFINKRLRIPEHVVADALAIMFDEKMKVQKEVTIRISQLLTEREQQNSHKVRAEMEKLTKETSLERAYEKISVYSAFHGGKSPKLTAGWQLALLAGVSPEVALKNVNSTDLDGDNRNMAHYAAWSGNWVAIEYVQTNHNKLLNESDREGLKVVQYAAWSGNKDMLVKFLSNQSQVALNVILYAALSGDPATLEYVLSLIDLEYFESNPEGIKLIAENAALSGKQDVIDILLKRTWSSSYFEAYQKGEEPCILAAARSGNLSLLQNLLEKYPKLAESSSRFGNIAHYGARSGNPEMLRWICKTYPKLGNPSIVGSAIVSRDPETLNAALDISKQRIIDFRHYDNLSYLDALETTRAALEINTNVTEVHFPFFMQKNEDPTTRAAIQEYLRRNQFMEKFHQQYPESEKNTLMTLLDHYSREDSTGFFKEKDRKEKAALREWLETPTSNVMASTSLRELKKEFPAPSARLKEMMLYMEARIQVDESKAAREHTHVVEEQVPPQSLNM